MTTTKQTLHDEHAEFVPYLDLIRKAADGVGEFPPGAMRAMLDEIHEFLSHKLIPHAVAEGRVLYPVVRQVSGTPEVTVRMNRCHVELGRFADEVARLRGSLGTSPRQEQELRRVLYGLHTVVRVHFEEEEDLYSSTVESTIPPETARKILGSMEQAARELRELYE
ncbi:MAG TPA: hemerythrin domain-containing protein [Actinomycetota bacterium]|nr:hemerythrin domain-containing protein [Actinomycetota bacterium]